MAHIVDITENIRRGLENIRCRRDRDEIENAIHHGTQIHIKSTWPHPMLQYVYVPNDWKTKCIAVFFPSEIYFYRTDFSKVLSTVFIGV